MPQDPSATADPGPSSPFLACTGEMAERIRGFDWSPTLGPIEDWPPGLLATVGLVLRARVPLVLLWGADGIMIYNDGYATFAGNRHPGLLGMPVLKAWPEAAALNREVLDVCLAGGTLAFTERELTLDRRGRPEQCWLDLSYSPVVDDEGRPAGVIAFVVETTEQVLARRAAAEAADRLRQMFEDAPSFMAQLEGPEHVYTGVNKAYRKLIGGREVIGKTAREALPEIEGQGFFERLDQVYRSGVSDRGSSVPVMLRTADGGSEQRWVDFIYQPVRDARDEVVGIFVEGTDVTAGVVATTLIRANAERLAFLNRLTDALAETTDADTILAVTTRMVGEQMGVSICAYADMDEDADGFTIRGDWSAPGSPSIVGRYRLADFGRLAVQELTQDRPLILHDIEAEIAPEEAATFAAIGIKATICMPLVKHGRLTALMAVHHREPHRWTELELELMREVTERSWAHVERVRDEAARRDSAERLRLATTAAQIGTFDYDPVSGALRWDARCKELFGLPASAEVSYEIFLAGLHPGDRERVSAVVAATLDPDSAGSYEIEYRTVGLRDHRLRWIAASGQAFFHNGVAVRFVGTVLEITAQKALEERLRESESQFRAMAQAMPNHVWSAKPDGALDWFNERVYAYSGAAPGRLDGAGWAAIVHPADLPAALERWAASLASGETYQTEFRLRRADGLWRWHLGRAVPIRAEDGRIARWIGTNTDIQEHKEIVGALADLNNSLERRVEERTRDLRIAEEALRQSQKMEAVGQLTGGIAHDFNNLLQGINGSLELLLQRVAKGRLEGIDRFVQTALESTARAASLTHRLLAFSRRQALDPKPTDANALVGNLEGLLRQSMGPAIVLDVVKASGLWHVNVDPPQLENSLLNLCINARDAMPDGGTLTIATGNEPLDAEAARVLGLAAGEYVFLRVSDTGVGMPPEVVSRAFEPFFTTKPIGKGTGLGLSMVYGFVQQSGGGVAIASEPGRGSCVTLRFPRHLAGLAIAPGTAAMPKLAGAGETVLVIDDEENIRMIVAETLRESGYRVLLAGDGAAGLRYLRSPEGIDLMITDVGLPGGMNGRQVADAARSLRPELKVLFVTGYAESAASMSSELGSGMAILAKPFSLETLLARARQLLGER